MEIEVFVHGALCIAYSGRCLLSGYFNHRDANQGTCTNACRWDYKMANAATDEAGQAKVINFEFNKAVRDAEHAFSSAAHIERHPLADQTYLIEEANRPGELMPIMEDEHGTYIMNSKDLRAVEYVEQLVKIGVDSLKIEGRTKSVYYVSRAAQVYRQAIDDAAAGRPFNPALLADLDGLSNRGYTTGFYQRHRSQETQNYLEGHSKSKRSIYVGQVKQIAEGWATVEVKNKFAVGDTLELIHPNGNQLFTLDAMRAADGGDLEVALGSGIDVAIPLDQQYDQALITRILVEAD